MTTALDLAYTPVGTSTHGLPALIFTLTDEKIYFQSPTGALTDLDSSDGGIDSFSHSAGTFVVPKGRLTIALWKVRAHDAFGIQW